MADYFFELLTEEIPAWMHDAAAATLRERLSALTPEVTVNTTPRRIIFLLKNLAVREADREQEVKGPPKKSPEAALQGFLKKQGATADDIIASDDDYIRIRKKITGRATADILREQIPQIIESLRWPKMMRWGKGEHSYIRPIHTIVSLFEGEPLPISIFGTESGVQTVGHRTLAPKRFTVGSYNDYVTKLELARVVVDPLRRREVMVHRARTLANEVEGKPSEDASIWSQWQYLTEYPGVVRAEFRREYLALPEEVLVTVMRVHQKQLPIRDKHDRLTNSFLAVLDNDGDPEGNAAYGNSFVTNARFADAQFFYETDRRRKLEERLEQLSHLQFQEKLGNYLDKTKRIERIAGGILDDADVATAARLCKTDLVTEMVKEFTDLQGHVGGIYAREEGLPENVWQAIYDHYRPVSLDDALPRNVTGAVVSLADRIDTLVGFFSIGAKPTGSKDPFGLRRAAQGVVQILLNRDKREMRIGIDKLIDLGLEAYVEDRRSRLSGQAGLPDPHQLRDDLLAFFAERVRTILEASAWQFAYDEIAAAMESGWSSSLTDLVDRVAAVKAMRGDANFLSVLDSAKRIANITEGHTSIDVDPSKFEHDAEKRLLTDLGALELEDLIAHRDYRAAMERFASLAPALEQFFKDVMVNVEDASVRGNRMSLLRKVGQSVKTIADVTKIVVDRRDYRAS